MISFTEIDRYYENEIEELGFRVVEVYRYDEADQAVVIDLEMCTERNSREAYIAMIDSNSYLEYYAVTPILVTNDYDLDVDDLIEFEESLVKLLDDLQKYSEIIDSVGVQRNHNNLKCFFVKFK